MKRAAVRIVWIGAITALLAGCGNGASTVWRGAATPAPTAAGKVSPGTQPDAAAARQTAQAYNAFGLELLEDLAAADAKTSVFVSPASIAEALSLVMNGAQGATREAMARTLHLETLGDGWNEGAAALRQSLLQADPKVEFTVANSIWAKADPSLKFQDAFLEAGKKQYDAEINSVDFQNPKTVGTMNKWVDKNTKGKIKEIVKAPIDPDTFLFVLNAIYFKGAWTKPFEKSATQDRPFKLGDGTSKSVPFMRQSGSYAYKQADGYQAVRLPYGDSRYGMLILLPDEGGPLDPLLQRLSGPNAWEQARAGWKEQQPGEIVLPRFKLEQEFQLKDTLSRLGMAIAFHDKEADFSSLLVPPKKAFISEIKHKTFLQVDETGTEAAAVTSVEAKTSSAMVPAAPPFRMEMNRPFLIAIEEASTGALLFLGAIRDPAPK